MSTAEARTAAAEMRRRATAEMRRAASKMGCSAAADMGRSAAAEMRRSAAHMHSAASAAHGMGHSASAAHGVRHSAATDGVRGSASATSSGWSRVNCPRQCGGAQGNNGDDPDFGHGTLRRPPRVLPQHQP